MAVIIIETIRKKSPVEALKYVRYRHDEKTKAPVFDTNGKMMLREDYYLDGLECAAAGFPLAFENLCRKYGRIMEDEIIMYQIIISYNPKDKAEYLLDGEKAQKLSLMFAQNYLKGLLGIVCTHLDGDNHAGNIHTHIYLAAIKYSNEYCHEMEYPINMMAGYKINIDMFTERELRRKLSEMVEREGLHPDNLTILPDIRISNREYHVRASGQRKLDAVNEVKLREGIRPEQLVFRTDKQIIRDAIDETLKRTRTETEFRKILSDRFSVRTVEGDGVWRYGLEGEKATFAAPSLGRLYLWEHIQNQLEQNRELSELPVSKQDRKQSDLFLEKYQPTTEEIWESMSYARKLWGLPYDLYELMDKMRSVWENSFFDKLIRRIAPILKFFSERHIETFTDLENRKRMAKEGIQTASRMIEVLTEKLRIARNIFHFGKIVEKARSLPLVMEEPNLHNRNAVTNRQVFEDAVGFLQEQNIARDFTSSDLWKEKMITQRYLDEWQKIQKEWAEEQNLIEEFCKLPSDILIPLKTIDQYRYPLFEEKMGQNRESFQRGCKERTNRYADLFQNILFMEQERNRVWENPEPVYVEKTRIPIDYER